MIENKHLWATEGRAPGIVVYGGPGLLKSHTICTLVPPVLSLDLGEGGTASYAPWIRRRRKYNETKWTVYAQEQREKLLELLDPETKARVPLKPGPYVDVIQFDNMKADSHDAFVATVATFDSDYYNSISVDSLQELSISTQTYAKVKGGSSASDLMELKWWAGAQERAQIILRKLRNYRDAGVLVYLIGAEDISKDYVKNPREKSADERSQEPYNIRGTIDTPGKLSNAIAHLPDILVHARMLNGGVVWVAEPESLPGGYAYWDAKDRYGRLGKYAPSNVRKILDLVCGPETRKEMYAAGISKITQD